MVDDWPTCMLAPAEEVMVPVGFVEVEILPILQFRGDPALPSETHTFPPPSITMDAGMNRGARVPNLFPVNVLFWRTRSADVGATSDDATSAIGVEIEKKEV